MRRCLLYTVCPLDLVVTDKKEYLDYKNSMITGEDPLRGLLFYWDLSFSHTLHVLEERRRKCEHRISVLGLRFRDQGVRCRGFNSVWGVDGRVEGWRLLVVDCRGEGWRIRLSATARAWLFLLEQATPVPRAALPGPPRPAPRKRMLPEKRERLARFSGILPGSQGQNLFHV